MSEPVAKEAGPPATDPEVVEEKTQKKREYKEFEGEKHEVAREFAA